MGANKLQKARQGCDCFNCTHQAVCKKYVRIEDLDTLSIENIIIGYLDDFESERDKVTEDLVRTVHKAICTKRALDCTHYRKEE
jgi:hypothetical protein